jgi:hypothetical protein
MAHAVLLLRGMKKPSSSPGPRAGLDLEVVSGGMPSGSSSFRSPTSTRHNNVSFDSNPPREHSYYTYMGKSDQAKYESLPPKYQQAISTKSPEEQLSFLDRRR